jgi:hypothetical protein
MVRAARVAARSGIGEAGEENTVGSSILVRGRGYGSDSFKI